jgi:hypothetical protein
VFYTPIWEGGQFHYLPNRLSDLELIRLEPNRSQPKPALQQRSVARVAG